MRDAERRILYEDPDLHFCILAHVYKGAKSSSPHDHGRVGRSTAGDRRHRNDRLEAGRKARERKTGKVVKGRIYDLTPGKAHVYNEGRCAFAQARDETRLIRIEGVDLTKVKRDKFEIAA